MKLDRQLVKCRAFGHAWDEDIEPINVRPLFANQQFARCLRDCGTHRIQSLAADIFTVIQTEYRYLSKEYTELYTPMSRAEAKGWLVRHPVRRQRRQKAS